MWIEYTEPNQLPVGEYLWRVPHRYIDDVVTIFRAKVRRRGYGYRDAVTSPDFDQWDGYQLHLPKPTQYRDISPDDPILTIEGLVLRGCPFCGGAPNWGSAGGYIGARPNRHDSFWVEHCFARVQRQPPLPAAGAWNTRAPQK